MTDEKCEWDPEKHDGKKCPKHVGDFDVDVDYDFENWGNEQEINKKINKALDLIKSSKLPDGIEPQEYLGGTMDSNGNIVNMKKFKDGYLVSCGNDSFKENRDFLINDKNFIKNFMKYSSDGELYIGSWFENGKNNNEPTIWVKDKETAIMLAKKTGQYSITDCKAYNDFNCENYKLLNDEQFSNSYKIFIKTCGNKAHKIKLNEVKL